MNLNSLDIESYVPARQPKAFLTLTNFSINIFLFGVGKTFALNYFLTLKNCVLEAL